MRLRHLVFAAIAAAPILLGAQRAHATVVERVVAVVGEQPILQTELRQRARPFLLQIQSRMPSGAQRAAAESELFKQVLARMIDDRLERIMGEKHHINVTTEEIDNALGRLSQMQNMTVDQLIGEAIRSGLTAQEYREELRRQILEGKLMELRVKGRVRVTEEEMRAVYTKAIREERARLPYRLQWIVVRAPLTAGPSVVAQKRALAEKVAKEAQAGADFAALAKKYSDDNATAEQGGDLGPQTPGSLEEAIEKVAAGLEAGQVSAPFVFGDALVVLRLASRDASKIGSYEQVKDILAQRVHAEQMELAKRKWLDGLKRSIHVESRL